MWLDSTGLVRRLVPSPEVARPLLGQVADAIRRLPSSGIPIGRLAAECCGDAHAFDDGRPAGTLVLSAARALAAGSSPGSFAAEGNRREAWAAVGVYLDDLSSLVTCLGLDGDTRTPVGRVLVACQEAGQPVTFTLRQLRCHTDPLPARIVRVCENPVVLAAAADEYGNQCPPMVCVSGHPSAAGWRLLEMLAASGACLEYHGDFDWGGVRIASAVIDRVGARPWRYDSAAYLNALSTLRPDFPKAALTGEPAATSWDPSLAGVMRSEGIHVEEELVIDALLSDLSPGAGCASHGSKRSEDSPHASFPQWSGIRSPGPAMLRRRGYTTAMASTSSRAPGMRRRDTSTAVLAGMSWRAKHLSLAALNSGKRLMSARKTRMLTTWSSVAPWAARIVVI